MKEKATAESAMAGKLLPDKIYAAVVRSLYADSRSLLVGIICMATAPLILYWKMLDHAQLVFSGLFLVFGIARMILAREFGYWTNDGTAREEFKSWENRYLVLSSLYIGIIGLWTVYCFWYSTDVYVQTLSISLVLCYLSGVIGRNFGSDKLVIAQVTIGSSLIVTALLGTGDFYNMLLAAFLAPFFLAIRFMSARLRNMLHSSAIAAEENQVIATQLDMALENVTHGIAMFSPSGEITVANERFLVLSNMESARLIGEDVSALSVSSIVTSNGETLLHRLKKNLLSHSSQKFTYRLPDDRIVEADFNSMDEGGVVVLSDITERVNSEKAIRDLANFDALTRLPNRRFFVSEMERRLMRRGELKPCSMFFVDLDKFKEVNDTLGHSVGDSLLKAVSLRFGRIIKNTDLMCRFGGDEFVLVLPGVVEEPACRDVAERIIAELSMPIQIDHHTITIGASVGIAIAPKDGKTAEELLQYTDAALYESKSQGRGLYTFYSPELGSEIRLRRELEIDLKAAVHHGELGLHFQPLVNLKTGRISTCEALARWNHPVHGNISPERFVRIAEESGFIGELGNYVLKQAMLECLQWEDNVRVAVNVSSIQFHRSDVYGTIARLLRETRLPPDRLEVEITESVMLSSFAETVGILERLHELGVRISLDDFGTGFSSLSYLHQLPLDKVKIDRSFIRNGVDDPRSYTLLQGVVNLTKALGLTVVLEGIETDAQLSQIANNMEIDEVQGYLFSRPLPPKDLHVILGRFNPTETSGSDLRVVNS